MRKEIQFAMNLACSISILVFISHNCCTQDAKMYHYFPSPYPAPHSMMVCNFIQRTVLMILSGQKTLDLTTDTIHWRTEAWLQKVGKCCRYMNIIEDVFWQLLIRRKKNLSLISCLTWISCHAVYSISTWLHEACAQDTSKSYGKQQDFHFFSLPTLLWNFFFPRSVVRGGGVKNNVIRISIQAWSGFVIFAKRKKKKENTPCKISRQTTATEALSETAACIYFKNADGTSVDMRKRKVFLYESSVDAIENLEKVNDQNT